jgi:hypothetical protein
MNVEAFDQAAPSRQPNPAERLEQIDKEAISTIKSMERHAVGLREGAANLVVAGVRMSRIAKEFPVTWDAFIAAKKITCKGRDKVYRQIASVVFRRGGVDDELLNPTKLIPDSQISRYGAAIKLADEWVRTATASLDPSDHNSLFKMIIAKGGVRAMTESPAPHASQAGPELSETSEPTDHTPDRPSVADTSPAPTEVQTAPLKAPVESPAEIEVKIRIVRPAKVTALAIRPNGEYVVLKLTEEEIEGLIAA